jgi:hypothetical protein
VGDVTFRGKTGGSSGYEGLIFRREGSINESTGKISKPFEFTMPISTIDALYKTIALMIEKCVDE